ncbi:helix-turn-helix domain-containing protein [Amycolatopsis sp. Hca4]|uniref:helix-turn-helix domain-containing protein n=1 Tax=Amycolatopsis sp. Hca4 TaxID=2742131 RepID=UPI0034CFE37B
MTEQRVQDEELTEIVENLRLLGSDVSDVEVKKAQGGLPRSARETVVAFANTRGGTLILGLDEGGTSPRPAYPIRRRCRPIWRRCARPTSSRPCGRTSASTTSKTQRSWSPKFLSSLRTASPASAAAPE